MKFKKGDRVRVSNPDQYTMQWLGTVFTIEGTDKSGCTADGLPYFYWQELSPAITRKDILKRIKEYNDKVPFVPVCND